MTRHPLQFALLTALLLTVSAAAQKSSLPAAGPQVGSKNSAIPIIMFTAWRDPREGAFTLNVPQGWKINGGTVRNANIDVRQIVRAVSPDGAIRIFIGDPGLTPNQVPDRMTQFGGFREGQTIKGAWGGPVRLLRYQSGEQFARLYSSKLCPAPRITGSSTLQAASQELSARAAEYGRATGASTRAEVGEVSFQCDRQVGYVRASTVLASPVRGQGAQVWDVLELSGFIVTDPSRVAIARYTLNNMVGSFRLDPQWERRQAQITHDVTGAVTRAQMQMADSIAQHAQEQARTDQVDVMSGWEQKNKTMDAVMQRGSDARRGTTTAEDPITGSHTVSNDYDFYWTRPDGSMMGTNTDNPPDNSSGWRMMQTH